MSIIFSGFGIAIIFLSFDFGFLVYISSELFLIQNFLLFIHFSNNKSQFYWPSLDITLAQKHKKNQAL
ncbi:MAG TPA: hypothetical protein DCS08_02600 [Candidatus Moranbacteria bacterium]|nr:hypothetical protein [Candidatus Moranbacteria bacterium]HBY10981.1 hypothetical protein [Candidatus Moranbacteria bacterium]